MNRSSAWSEFESGEGLGLRVLRILLITGGVFFLGFTGILELTWPQQIILGLLTIFIAIWMDRSSSSYLVTLTLMFVSMFSTFRYGYWRISTTVKFFADPSSAWTTLDAFFISLLVIAEAYAFIILFLGYLQTLWPLRRTPVPLPDDPDAWPSVDLLIPTYNEPLSVVRYTALAAMNIDWPADKLNVYILDDGKRPEFRAFAEEAGIGYMTRDDNQHAKAGNINRALARLDSPYVCIFDCDHVPTRSFMQVTLGWFLRDSKLGMLQTPHHFYSPDPFERNLHQFRTIPNEGELFYGIVQDGNDFWNATFFSGSCAVLRRTALDEIGGIAVETVTEDAHTSLRMQMNGWNTAYINIPQAAGLATERLSGHVKQRIRWARGMIQIMRTDNPLFAKGLKPAQRLCYFNAMLHFLYAFPRLIFLTAPLIYLLLGYTNVPGYWAAILAYAFPHLVLSSMTNSRIQGQHRHSFWNEIYETVLAPYIFLPTMLALINPKFGSFNVTAKGGVVNKTFFDSRIAQPFMLMLGMNVIGLLAAIPRYLQFPGAGMIFPLNLLARMYDADHLGTIVMNLIWVFFNMVILGVATAVAWESQQRRQTVRIEMAVPAKIVTPAGVTVHGTTANMSPGGVMINMEREFFLPPAESVNSSSPSSMATPNSPPPSFRPTATPSALSSIRSPSSRRRRSPWCSTPAPTPGSAGASPARSIAPSSASSASSSSRSWASAKPFKASSNQPAPPLPPKGRLATSIVPVLLLLLLASPSASALGQAEAPSGQTQIQAAQASGSTNAASTRDGGVQARDVPPGNFDKVFSLADVGIQDAIVLRGVDAYQSVFFSVPQTQVVRSATMHIRYHFSPGLVPSLSHLKVSLNGTLFATLAVTQQPTPGAVQAAQQADQTSSGAGQSVSITRSESSAILEATIAMPAEMLVHQNELNFEFVGHYTTQCEDPSSSALWSHVDATSTIELAGALLPLQNDLKLLPLPFYDASVNLHPVVPIVFLAQPSPKAMQAAGIIASWFGIYTDFRPVRFPVSFGSIPAGNVIVISENSAELPTSFSISGSSGPTIAMRPNPSDPYSKLLVISGDNPDDLVTAAMALTLQRDLLQGDQMRIASLRAPAPRAPDDAPRWLSTSKVTHLGDIAQTGDLNADGGAPVRAYMRLPPDLFYGNQRNVSFHMSYRYNGIPISNESSLQVYVNDGYVSSTPLPHNDRASAQLDALVPVPVPMRPFSNSLMMQFVFLLPKKGRCQDTAPSNLKGSILKDSYIDIQDIPHWAVLPNLEIFANAGYPFTRKADLSDTTVVLPDTPAADEIEMYLTMMGHFGAQPAIPSSTSPSPTTTA